MTAASPPTVPVQPPETPPPKSRRGIKIAGGVIAGLVLLGGGFAAGYAVGHSPVPGYQQQIATAHNNLGAEQVKLAAEKAIVTTEQGQVTTARQTAQNAVATVNLKAAAIQKLQRQLKRERALAASAGTGTTAQPPSSSGPAATFACKILQTGASEEFDVTTTGGSSYGGTVYVSFYGPTGSGQVFPSTTVNGATPTAAWHQVPAADIGASAEPIGCIASAG
jgi:hypothetical protein